MRTDRVLSKMKRSLLRNRSWVSCNKKDSAQLWGSSLWYQSEHQQAETQTTLTVATSHRIQNAPCVAATLKQARVQQATETEQTVTAGRYKRYGKKEKVFSDRYKRIYIDILKPDKRFTDSYWKTADEQIYELCVDLTLVRPIRQP